MYDPPVPAQRGPVLIQEGTRRIVRPGSAADKGAVVPVGYKADVLAVPLAGVEQAGLCGDLPHLFLGQLPQREQGPGQLLLVKDGQYVALVLVQVGRLFQQPAAGPGVPVQAGVVAGGDFAPAQLVRPAEQRAEFQPPVALDAGVGGLAQLVSADKGLHHIPPEAVRQIEYIVGNPQAAGGGAGVLHVVQGAAGAFPLQAGQGVVHQLQGNAHHIMSLPLEEQGGGGAVHASAHGGGSLLIHRDLHGHFAEITPKVYHIFPLMATGTPGKTGLSGVNTSCIHTLRHRKNATTCSGQSGRGVL